MVAGNKKSRTIPLKRPQVKVENISRFKKERFLKSLSEDEFRDKAVRPLLLRLGLTDGRDLCGPNEHGKDSVFGEVDKLGFNIMVAVQTKKGHLNLASKATVNLVEAITQLKTALETSVSLLCPKSKVRPNKAILCASGRINEAARQYIIDEVKNPNIQFLDSDDMIPHIDKSLPELWLGIDTDMLPYLSMIEQQMSGIGDAETGQDGQDGVLAGAADDKVFIGIRLYRRIKKRKTVGREVIETPAIEEFPLTSIVNKKSRRVLITGEGGAGKSTGLMRIALEIARSAIAKDSKYRIPIYLKAVEILRAKPENLVSYCEKATKDLTHADKSCFNLDDLVAGNVVLMIDALDELSTNLERKEVLTLVSTFCQNYPKCQVILTSRPYRFTSELPELKSFDEYHICPISWRQAEKIIHAVTEHRQAPKAQCQELLRRLEKIHGIELNPLLVTVFAATTDFTKQDIPANITELFKKFTELMLGRWDEKKGFKHQYQAPLKDFVLTKIAFYLHSQKKTSINRSEAESIAINVLSERGHDADVPKMLTEIFERSGLFRILGKEIEFKHHLLQEFFAGRGIEVADFIQSALTEEWWKRAIVFYFGENPGRVDLLLTSLQSVTARSSLVEAATTAGLALQACYLSPVAEKLDVWKLVAEAISVSEHDFIKAMDPDCKSPTLDFFTYYLYSRDSVALTHLKQQIPSLLDWAKSRQELAIDGVDRRYFWLLVGLIECGELAEAEKLVRKFNPTDGKLLTAIHLGCHMAIQIRPLSFQEKEWAKEICKRLDSRVAPFRKQLIREIGSTLLEMREGKIQVLDDEVSQVEQES